VTSGAVRAYFRLLAVQAAWNYERMTGIGLGYAAEPLLEDLKLADPTRHAEAAVRSAEYFNSHPYLAGLALGALVRAEYDQVPGQQITRLRTALASPLGALGDQFFWAGLVPLVMGAAVAGVVLGGGLWVLGATLLFFNGVRLATGIWALRTGLESGTRVGAAIGDSWLRAAVPRVGLAAGLAAGVALPLGAAWLLESQSAGGTLVAMATVLVAVLAAWRFRPVVTSIRFGLTAVGVTALLAWAWP
jgi:PTS system mannose-specific IID component